ncbi:Major facilitator superfamily domain, general substrate transporter [Akanthomyces lecanii RCEF 1005]|uniref:Major facilitator superfamily domain, general substrate transporter n=1 Tax=Akanthomyces lecanii RCEF 1005 TaxID=1081108 RepID=A0A162N5H9_CORDF|nr:Major facilitator superfamily domain, general substrate transporter [Akanthomyces lecanii RCEF 1005]
MTSEKTQSNDVDDQGRFPIANGSAEAVEHKDANEAHATHVIESGVHEHMNLRLFTSLVALSFLWVGSQIPLYIYGSVLPDIYGDIGGSTNGRWVWMVIGYLIPNAALCPFVGALSDLFGRKWVAAFGQVMLLIAPVVVSTAHTINTAIAGMVIAGLGAGLNELIALAGTSELVPVRKRAMYVGGVVFTILPFCPSPLWAQLITKYSNWRYNGYLVGGWNLIGLVLVLCFYKEPTRTKRSAREILGEVDFIGGFLSTAGVVLFMMGMQWGAREYSWVSVEVLVTFLLGSAFIAAFFVYETRFAKCPMIPPRIFSRDKQTMIAILLVTFFSGGNFFVLLLFWPTQVYNVYGNDAVQIGIRTLPIGFGIIFGSLLNLGLIRLTKGRIRVLMIVWCVFMTAFVGAMSVARTDNLNPTVYAIITLASVGVGAVIIPCSLIAQVTCPTDLIGTITAITLSIRYIGGAVGFAAFYNVFFHKYYELANTVAAPRVANAKITLDFFELIAAISLGSNAEYEKLHELIATSPTISHRDTAFQTIIDSTMETFVIAYRWPYWISIAFGSACIICSLFLRNIRQFIEEAF